jgi:hypothetical protein
MQYVERRNLIIWFSIIAVLYVVLTKIDLIVHYDLYQYGLVFSIEWAQPYWICLTACFWGLAALSVASYWLESRNKNKALAALVVATILLPYYFGFEDVLWFIWRGGFPAENVEWTWYWLNGVFGVWTTQKHLIFASVGLALLVGIWVLVLAKRWVSFDFRYLRRYKPKRG